jgi:cell division protein FtsL
MSKRNTDLFGLSLIIKKAIEGRVGPLSFILLLGFVSSVLLLYISLGFHIFSISEQLDAAIEREKMLQNENGRLRSTYNELTSREKIIPYAELLDMRECTSGEVERLAVYEQDDDTETVSRWARAGTADVVAPNTEIEQKGR